MHLFGLFYTAILPTVFEKKNIQCFFLHSTAHLQNKYKKIPVQVFKGQRDNQSAVEKAMMRCSVLDSLRWDRRETLVWFVNHCIQ